MKFRVVMEPCYFLLHRYSIESTHITQENSYELNRRITDFIKENKYYLCNVSERDYDSVKNNLLMIKKNMSKFNNEITKKIDRIIDRMHLVEKEGQIGINSLPNEMLAISLKNFADKEGISELLKLRLVSRRWCQVVNMLIADALTRVKGDVTSIGLTTLSQAIHLARMIPATARHFNLRHLLALPFDSLRYSEILGLNLPGNSTAVELPDDLEVEACDDAMTSEDINNVLSIETLEILDLSGYDSLTLNHFQLLSNKGRLRTLKLRGCAITDDDLDWIVKIPNLRSLDLSENRNLTDAGIAKLAHATQLRKLKLHNCHNVSDNSLKSLSSLHKLKVLDIAGCDLITSSGICNMLGGEETINFPNLLHVDLSALPLLDDTIFGTLIKQKKMKSLDLSDCIGISSAGLANLSKIQTLISLRLLRMSQVNSSVIESLTKLKELIAVDLSECQNIDTDTLVIFLLSSTSLRSLSLNKCQWIDSRIVTVIGERKNLEALALSGCKGIAPEAFDDLLKLKNLKILEISSNNSLNKTHLQTIASMNRLSHLSLSNSLSSLDEITCRSLFKIKCLRYLDLRGSSNFVGENLLQDLIEQKPRDQIVIY